MKFTAEQIGVCTVKWGQSSLRGELFSLSEKRGSSRIKTSKSLVYQKRSNLSVILHIYGKNRLEVYTQALDLIP